MENCTFLFISETFHANEDMRTIARRPMLEAEKEEVSTTSHRSVTWNGSEDRDLVGNAKDLEEAEEEEEEDEEEEEEDEEEVRRFFRPLDAILTSCLSPYSSSSKLPSLSPPPPSPLS